MRSRMRRRRGRSVLVPRFPAARGTSAGAVLRPHLATLAGALAVALCGGDRDHRGRPRCFGRVAPQRLDAMGMYIPAPAPMTACLGCCARSIGRFTGWATTPRLRVCAALPAILSASLGPAMSACSPRWRRVVSPPPSTRHRCGGARRTVGCAFATALNARHVWAGDGRMPPDQLLRQVFETCTSYGEARAIMEQTPVSRAVIYTLVGCAAHERCVIERTEDASSPAKTTPARPTIGCHVGPAGKAGIGAQQFQLLARRSHAIEQSAP